MKRIIPVIATLLVGLLQLAFIPQLVSASNEKPNIILIVADDQGYSDVSFRGSGIKTPHLDALAASGAALNRFYACPICSPTRAGLMTGCYPIRFGMQRAVNRPFSELGLLKELETLPEMTWLRARTYRRCIPTACNACLANLLPSGNYVLKQACLPWVNPFRKIGSHQETGSPSNSQSSARQDKS